MPGTPGENRKVTKEEPIELNKKTVKGRTEIDFAQWLLVQVDIPTSVGGDFKDHAMQEFEWTGPAVGYTIASGSPARLVNGSTVEVWIPYNPTGK